MDFENMPAFESEVVNMPPERRPQTANAFFTRYRKSTPYIIWAGCLGRKWNDEVEHSR